MKLLVLGATGPTGHHVVTQALERGHEVIALVRTPSKLTTANDNLKVVQGDPTSASDVKEQLVGCHAVLSCLGGKPGIGTPCDVYSGSGSAVAAAMKEVGGVERFVAITAMGTTDVPGLPFLWRTVLKPTVMKNIVADMRVLEEYLASPECAHVNYTVVKPPRLTDGPAGKEGRLIAEEGQIVQANSNVSHVISRQDLASFMLDILTAKDWDRKLVSLSSNK